MREAGESVEASATGAGAAASGGEGKSGAFAGLDGLRKSLGSLPTPAYDLIDQADGYQLRVELPGVGGVGELELDVAADRVTLVGKSHRLEVGRRRTSRRSAATARARSANPVPSP